MKYLSTQSWNKLPTGDFRSRFFVEAFTEKLSMYAPHFHQARLMNIFSACRETLTYIDEYRFNDKNGAYIRLGVEEIESCLEADVVAKDIFQRVEGVTPILFRKMLSGDLSPMNLNRLSSVCKSILFDQSRYQTQLVDELSRSLFAATDLKQMGRVTSRISDLTGLYITDLLNKGYSPTYLYNRVEMFTRLLNYSGRSFQQQFESVAEKLRSYTTSFEVYFAVLSTKAGAFLETTDEHSIQFLSDISEVISKQNLEKLRKEFEPNLFVKIGMSSTDYVSASCSAKETLDKVLDAVTALELNSRVRVSSSCVSISKNAALTHEKALNVGILNAFLTSENGTHLSNSRDSIHRVNTKLNEKGKEHLGRSLRYLRLARESVSLEQKLLNLWIALESLFSDGDGSIIANITHFVPQFYAVTGLSRRVIYIRELLIKNAIRIPPNVASVICTESQVFDAGLDVADVFLMLRNKDACTELCQSLGGMEHLKFRLISVYQEILDNASLSRRVKRSENDVTRQLRRIYFLRNKITHTGHYENIRPQLITHLMDYLVVSYMAISEAASLGQRDNDYSIGELLDSYKMGTEQIANSLIGKNALSSFSQILPVPVM